MMMNNQTTEGAMLGFTQAVEEGIRRVRDHLSQNQGDALNWHLCRDISEKILVEDRADPSIHMVESLAEAVFQEA